MSKNRLLAVSFFISILLSLNLFAETECSSFDTSLKLKSIKTERQIESIKFLIEESGGPQLPLELVFQVDVTDPQQISRRLKEVRRFLTVDSLLGTSDFKDLLKCEAGKNAKSALSEYANRLVELNLLKVKFFEFSEEKRKVLLENYNSKRALNSDMVTVQKEVQKTVAAIAEAETKLSENSGTTNELDGTPRDEDLAVSKITLQQYLVDYASEHLEFLKLVEDKKTALDRLKTEVSSIVRLEQSDEANVKDLLLSSNQSWERTVDFMSDLFSGLNLGSQVDLPEPLEPKVSFSEEDSKDYVVYIKTFEEAKRGRLEQAQKRIQIVDDLRFQAFQLLTESGQLRSRLFLKCDEIPICKGHRSLNSKNFDAFIREVQIIPLKIQAGAVSKVLEFKGKVRAGVEGWLNLFQQVISLLVLLAIPLLLLKSLNWFKARLDALRKSILTRSLMDFRKRTSIATWISRVNPFIPATGMALGVWIARQLIETTDIRELSQILFYFQLYFIYRISRLLIQILFEILFSSDSVSDLREQRSKVEASAKRISRLVFLEYAFLFLVETTARRALIYGLASNLIFYFNFVFFFWEAFRWNEQILSAIKLRFPRQIQYFEKLRTSRLLFFLSCPFLALVLVLRDFLHFGYSYLIRLDYFKKIHSEIFRRRIEANAEEEIKISPAEDYLKQFDYYRPADDSILVSRHVSAAEKSLEVVKGWLAAQHSEDLIIVVGNRGMGKTTVLNSIAKSIPGEVKLVTVPAKTIKSSVFFEFLSSTLGADIRTLDSVVQLDQSLECKKVVVVDDIQNLFLGEISGFDVYRLFVEILSLKTKNIFWCLSVNSRSWSYLKGALGNEHLYGKVIELTPWRDSEIQELILKRHTLTGFSRQFDKSIKAYGASGDELGQHAETQFFRLLWGQSRGNPRSALMYWISAISQAGSNRIIVGVPSFVSSSLVATMSDDSLFLLASIARHESLTQAEMLAVTGISNTVIRKCMKEALDKNLVWCDSSGRYRISSRAQYVIDYFLIGKNFLYE